MGIFSDISDNYFKKYNDSFTMYDVTSPFGERTDPITGLQSNHSGIDYALPLNTNVSSNVNGTVITSDYNYSYGNYVVVKDGTGLLHYYAHLNQRNVNVNDIISVGDSIGLSGSTGRSTGAHLHYEVREDGKAINPLDYFDKTSSTDKLPSRVIVGSIKDNIKDKIKSIVFNIFKFIVIGLLIVLFVVFITKSLDISII